MDFMLSLLGGHIPCFLFLHVFMQQLPDYVRTPLSMSGIKDYRAWYQEADRIYISGRSRIQEVNIPNQSTKPNSKQPSDLCWYHQRFVKNARNCSPNCKHFLFFIFYFFFHRKNFYLQKNSTKNLTYNYVQYLQPAILKYMSLD